MGGEGDMRKNLLQSLLCALQASSRDTCTLHGPSLTCATWGEVALVGGGGGYLVEERLVRLHRGDDNTSFLVAQTVV
jgi:hypothetical protein